MRYCPFFFPFEVRSS